MPYDQAQIDARLMRKLVKDLHSLAGEGREAELRWALWTLTADLPISESRMLSESRAIVVVFWLLGTLCWIVYVGVLGLLAGSIHPIAGYAVAVVVAALVVAARLRKWRSTVWSRAAAHYHKGNFAAAEVLLRRAVPRLPHDAERRSAMLAAIAWHQGETGAALRHAEAFLDRIMLLRSSAWRIALAQVTCAWLLADAGSLAEAQRIADQLDSVCYEAPGVRLQVLQLHLRLAFDADSRPSSDVVVLLDELLREFVALPDAQVSLLATAMALMGWAQLKLENSVSSEHWFAELEQRGDRDLLQRQLPQLAAWLGGRHATR